MGSDRVTSVSRKGMVVSAPQRQWLGFGVLWQFIQVRKRERERERERGRVRMRVNLSSSH